MIMTLKCYTFHFQLPIWSISSAVFTQHLSHLTFFFNNIEDTKRPTFIQLPYVSYFSTSNFTGTCTVKWILKQHLHVDPHGRSRWSAAAPNRPPPPSAPRGAAGAAAAPRSPGRPPRRWPTLGSCPWDPCTPWGNVGQWEVTKKGPKNPRDFWNWQKKTRKQKLTWHILAHCFDPPLAPRKICQEFRKGRLFQNGQKRTDPSIMHPCGGRHKAQPHVLPDKVFHVASFVVIVQLQENSARHPIGQLGEVVEGTEDPQVPTWVGRQASYPVWWVIAQWLAWQKWLQHVETMRKIGKQPSWSSKSCHYAVLTDLKVQLIWLTMSKKECYVVLFATSCLVPSQSFTKKVTKKSPISKHNHRSFGHSSSLQGSAAAISRLRTSKPNRKPPIEPPQGAWLSRRCDFPPKFWPCTPVPRRQRLWSRARSLGTRQAHRSQSLPDRGPELRVQCGSSLPGWCGA